MRPTPRIRRLQVGATSPTAASRSSADVAAPAPRPVPPPRAASYTCEGDATLVLLRRWGTLPWLRTLRLVRCPRLVSLRGLPPGVRSLSVVGCPRLRSLRAMTVATHLCSITLVGKHPPRSLRPIATVEELRIAQWRRLPRLVHLRGVRRLTLAHLPTLTNLVPGVLPPGLTHLRILGCPRLGRKGGLDALSGVARLVELRHLDLRTSEGLPAAVRRVYRGAEIDVLFGRAEVPAGVVSEPGPPPEGAVRGPSRRTHAFFRTWGWDDLQQAYARMTRRAQPLQAADDLQLLEAFRAAAQDWSHWARAAIARVERDPERRQDMLQEAWLALLRQASRFPTWRFAQASSSARIARSTGFYRLARKALAATRGAGARWDADVTGERAGAGLDKADVQTVGDGYAVQDPWRTADPEALAAPSQVEPVLVRIADHSVLRVDPEQVAVLRAIAPLWLQREEGGRPVSDPALGLRVVAALQPTPHTQTETLADALSGYAGVPVADLDDPVVRDRAWAHLDPRDRPGAEVARVRATQALARAVGDAPADVREAWNDAVALERAWAERRDTGGGAPDDEARAEAWQRMYGESRELAGVRRSESQKQARLALDKRRCLALFFALTGWRGADSRALAPWSASEVRGLLAWTAAWTSGAGEGRGLAHRTAAARIDALEALLPAPTRGHDPTFVVRASVLGHAGLLARALADERLSPVDRTRAERILAVAADAVGARGGAQEAWTAAYEGAPSVPGRGAAGPPDIVAVVLDAVERMAAAAWLGLPDEGERVAAALAASLAQADAQAQRRGRRVLTLQRARFPGLVPSSAPAAAPDALPTVLCVALGWPVLADPASSAFADDDDASQLAQVGWRGAAARVHVGGGRLVLVGRGWSVDGRTLVVEEAGTPLETHRALLAPGPWVIRDGRRRVVMTVQVRDA